MKKFIAQNVMRYGKEIYASLYPTHEQRNSVN